MGGVWRSATCVWPYQCNCQLINQHTDLPWTYSNRSFTPAMSKLFCPRITYAITQQSEGRIARTSYTMWLFWEMVHSAKSTNFSWLYYFSLLAKCLRGPDEIAAWVVVWRPLVYTSSVSVGCSEHLHSFGHQCCVDFLWSYAMRQIHITTIGGRPKPG